MNNLPKVVTQQRRGRASNPRLLDRKSDALPLSHCATRSSAVKCCTLSTSPVMSRLTSSFTCQLISIIITTLIIHHCFTLSLQAQNLPFQQILPTLILLPPRTGFTIPGPDRIYHASRVRLSLIFLFVSYGGLSWLHVSFLLHCMLNTQYRK